MTTSLPSVRTSCRIGVLAAALAGAAAAGADDWPQWRGPKRDDVSRETGLLKEWPAEGPARLWLFEDCGLGYAGPAISDGRVYIMGAREGSELLLCLDAATGREAWSAEIGPLYQNDWGDGPRGTPTVDGERIYALGGQGNLVCVNQDGDIQWSKSMTDLGGKVPVWGYTESPLIVGDRIVCTPGGEQGSLAALEKDSGELAWQSADVTSLAGYSSAVLAQRGANLECVQLLPDKVVGVNAQSGELQWSEGWPGRVAVIPTPIVAGSQVYVTSGYGAGCMLLDVGANDTVQKIYANKVMKNHHGGAILVGDHVYGHSDDRGWVCQDLKTGDAAWTERSALGKGSVAYADGMLYCLSEDGGEAVLADASPEGWKEHGRFTLQPQTQLRKEKGKIWTHPVISNGRLYLRDQNYLACFNVRDGATQSAARQKP